MADPDHGTRARYGKGCRCDPCKAANAAYSREWTARNPRQEYNREYRLQNLERGRENQRRWRKENPEKNAAARARYRKNQPWKGHHLSLDRYNEILTKQGGRCAGCGLFMGEYGRPFDVDHDHECCDKTYSCGKCIRGLLCRSCNLADALDQADHISYTKPPKLSSPVALLGPPNLSPVDATTVSTP